MESWPIVENRWGTGQITQLIPVRASLLDVARQQGAPANEIRGRIIASELHTLMLEKSAAISALEPFLVPGAVPLKPDVEALQKAESEYPPLLVAELHSAIANLLYRHFQFESGAKLTKKAEELLGACDANVDQRLARARNSIWKVRLRWEGKSAARRLEVDRLLEETTADLTALYKERLDDRAGAVDLLLGMALDLWAGLDWARGRLATARLKIYQSLFLLTVGRANDEIRRAFALFTAARIESATPQLDAAAELALRARELFERHGHQFRSRALNQEARCYAKADRLAQARALLDNPTLLHTVTDPDERRFVEAERDLTNIWLLERTAHESSLGWTKCLEATSALAARSDTLPQRLRAEANLHFGIALLHNHKPTDAKAALQKALHSADQNGREKIVTACYLWLAECCRQENKLIDARKQWSAALARGDHGSRFLREWRVALESRMTGPVLMDLSMPLSDAEASFWRHYLAYHIAHAASPESAFESTGLPRATFYAKCSTYDVETPWRRPKPRKRHRRRQAGPTGSTRTKH